MNAENGRRTLELAAFSAASLYFELAIIRFTAAEVLYLGYFSNFILIASFVGLGLGFLSARKPAGYDHYLPFILLFLFSLVLVSKFDVEILKNHFGLFFFGNLKGRAGLPGALLLVVLLLSTVMFFLCIGRRIALVFRKFRPLEAYTYDIIGSLIGIAIFSIQCLAAAGPGVWIITGGLLLLTGYLFSGDVHMRVSGIHSVIASLCVLLLLGSAQSGVYTVWSEYQKLEVVKDRAGPADIIYANGIVHQFMHPASLAGPGYYGYPYRLMQQAGHAFDRVLIIGAGSGTDAGVPLPFRA